ncbi:MAG TPA: hypothetical protein VK487_06330 [Candidatus Bathyarchaeia archaeon]|nr:hypothetical protein [Candidatus Bathyarchaeia archaeon]
MEKTDLVLERARLDQESDQGLLDEISSKIRVAKSALKRVGYIAMDVSPQEFFDYMTGEIFSEDLTTLRDVLGNEYIMVHELVEISELKKMGRTIDKRVITDSPKTAIYTAHFAAMETELSYALQKGDTYWAKWRLKMHKTSVLDDDPNLPEELRPKAEEILKRFSKLIETCT